LIAFKEDVFHEYGKYEAWIPGGDVAHAYYRAPAHTFLGIRNHSHQKCYKRPEDYNVTKSEEDMNASEEAINNSMKLGGV